MAGAIQVEASLQEQLSDHLRFGKMLLNYLVVKVT